MNTILLTSKDKSLIENSIVVAEKNTTGEIVVCLVKNSCCKKPNPSSKVREKAVRRRARSEFKKLGIGKTRHSTGCILLISLEDRFAAVFGGGPINKKVGKEGWPIVIKEVQNGMKSGDPVSGISKAVKQIGKRLCEYFPSKGKVMNELPNTVVEID